jgi:hypothetical protein
MNSTVNGIVNAFAGSGIKQIIFNGPVYNADYAFNNCRQLVNATFNTGSAVRNMPYAFSNCINLTTIIGNIAGAYNFSYVFNNCTNLTGKIVFSADNINNFNGAFSGTSKTKKVYMNTLNTSANSTYNSALIAGLNGNCGVTIYNLSKYSTT